MVLTVYTGKQGYTLVYTGIYFYALLYTDIHWNTLEYIGLHWYTLSGENKKIRSLESLLGDEVGHIFTSRYGHLKRLHLKMYTNIIFTQKKVHKLQQNQNFNKTA